LTSCQGPARRGRHVRHCKTPPPHTFDMPPHLALGSDSQGCVCHKPRLDRNRTLFWACTCMVLYSLGPRWCCGVCAQHREARPIPDIQPHLPLCLGDCGSARTDLNGRGKPDWCLPQRCKALTGTTRRGTAGSGGTAKSTLITHFASTQVAAAAHMLTATAVDSVHGHSASATRESDSRLQAQGIAQPLRAHGGRPHSTESTQTLPA
jgi:hypothetical protein